MISVRNHRQLLNGNKVILLLFIFVSFSCNAFRVIGDVKAPTTPKIETNDSEDISVDLPSGEKPLKMEEDAIVPTKRIVFHGQSYQVAAHKSSFDIALILPFYSSKANIPNRTAEIMVEYYQGVEEAMLRLEREGFKCSLHVYDNENDSVKLKSILSKLPRSIDFIVGPISEQHMRIVSEFAVSKRIGVFSPFSSVSNLDNGNTRFYSTAPSSAHKAKAVADFLKANHPNRKVYILRDGGAHDKDIVPHLTKELTTNGIKYDLITYAWTNNWATLLTGTDTNLVYIPSHSSATVTTTMGKLYSAKKRVIVLGEYSWTDFADNDFKFWDRLKVHVIASDFVDESNEEVRVYRETFRLHYKQDPSLYSYLGYDQFNFIGDFLMAFGEHYPRYLTNHSFGYLTSNYSFKLENGFNVNTHVFILKFSDYKLQTAN
ncbi:MAG: ABC-type branched-subunit amino acid transport system substrate-binding protein [Bacteroidia bacterium]|jgi:ABC-type branched-subunit amino acid transport system substrate-binding protein